MSCVVVASGEFCFDLLDEFLVVQSTEFNVAVKGSNEVRRHQSACFVVWGLEEAIWLGIVNPKKLTGRLTSF